jgi:hypothetical protein
VLGTCFDWDHSSKVLQSFAANDPDRANLARLRQLDPISPVESRGDQSGFKTIPNTRLVDQESGHCRLDFDLLAKRTHRYAEILDVTDMRFAPSCPQKMRMGQHLAGMSRHFGEQREFLSG